MTTSEATLYAGVVIGPDKTEAENWVVSSFDGRIVRTTLQIREVGGGLVVDTDAYKRILEQTHVRFYLRGNLWLEGEAFQIPPTDSVCGLLGPSGQMTWVTQKTLGDDRIVRGDKMEFKVQVEPPKLAEPVEIYGVLTVMREESA